MIEIHMVSNYLNIILQRMMDFYQREGYCFPSLILFNHGSPIYITDYQKETVLSIDSDDIPMYNIYKTGIALKVTNDEEEKSVQIIAKELVQQYKPDAIALIMQCLYRPITKNKNEITNIQTDPNVVRVLHSCAYNGPGKGIIRLIPYINKGEINFQITRSFDVMFSETGWEIEKDFLKPRISNPYN